MTTPPPVHYAQGPHDSPACGQAGAILALTIDPGHVTCPLCITAAAIPDPATAAARTASAVASVQAAQLAVQQAAGIVVGPLPPVLLTATGSSATPGSPPPGTSTGPGPAPSPRPAKRTARSASASPASTRGAGTRKGRPRS